MMLLKKFSTCLMICLVLLACCMQETEATRRVNRGRRTLTRRYFTGLAIPGWAVVTCVAVAELLLGAALYFAMYKIILDKEPEQASTYTPAPTHDPSSGTAQPVQPAQPMQPLHPVQPVPVTPSHATTIA
ncbi:PREDICTED: uncharacterized protein LOC108614372 [Drosophila arizonae]|uniref:Uncharacterized protein LOC108614372 n=1 Tax=Drosophila arizonae TaxID=7263 RepID=A0ABM1P9S1_DROAR|nr:PREDICTED: uncharacterized protein LOC108614372 [Drosophila arizonae]